MEVCRVSNDAENILKLVKQMRELFGQISLLLRTANEQMAKADWNSEGNTALVDLSWSIMNPTQWIPTNVFQFYRHKGHTNRLAYISVLLDDDLYGRYTIKEPLVTAGFLDYRQAEISDDEYWYARYYGYLSKDHNLKADGQHFHFDKAMLPTDLQGRFEDGEVFAVPLTSITNANDVEQQITKRLLELLKNEK
jgi:hypothetical protein